MTILIKYNTPHQIFFSGDGVTTSVTLSLDRFPFPERPPGKIVGIQLSGNSFNIIGCSFSGSTITVNFNPFTDNEGTGFLVTYDPS